MVNALRLLIWEVRVTARRLLLAPLFSCFAIGTLAVAIGGTTASYSALFAVFRSSPTVKDIDRLVVANTSDELRSGVEGPFTSSDLTEIRAQHDSFSSVSAWARFAAAIVGDGSSRLAQIEAVDGNFFPLLTPTALGRPINSSDNQPDSIPVIVLGDSVWRGQFSADPNILGKTMKIAGQQLVVVGVAPPGFRGLRSSLNVFPYAWVPLSFARFLRKSVATGDEGRRWLHVFASLAPGATAAGANSVLQTIAAHRQPIENRSYPGAAHPVQWIITPLQDAIRPPTPQTTMYAVLALPLLVLLIACSNLANLTLARGASRSSELSVRFALGGSWLRVASGQLLEAGFIGAIGGILSVVVSSLLMKQALDALVQPMAALAPGLTLHWRLEPRVLVVTTVATVASIVVAGLVPAHALASSTVSASLSAHSSFTATPRWRGRRNLIAIQVGVAVMLLLLAIVAVDTLKTNVNRGGPGEASGIDLKRTAVAYIPFEFQHYSVEQSRRSIGALVDQVRGISGVELVAVGTHLPLPLPWSPHPQTSILISSPLSEKTKNVSGRLLGVTSDTFRLMGIPFIAGGIPRGDQGNWEGAAVVVNEQFALAVYGTSAAVGREVSWQHDRLGPASPDAGLVHTAIIVGVVRGGGLASRSDQDTRVMFAPISETYLPTATLAVRVLGSDAGPIVSLLRDAGRRADSDLAVVTVDRADRVAGASAVIANAFATWALALALLAAALSMTGLYGVLSHLVGQRTREIALRMALGATPRQIIGLIIKEGLRPVVEGLAIGIVAAVAIRQLLQSTVAESLPGVRLVAILAMVGFLLIAAIATCYFPAVRASRAEPSALLKSL